jgi:hypothetical protein
MADQMNQKRRDAQDAHYGMVPVAAPAAAMASVKLPEQVIKVMEVGPGDLDTKFFFLQGFAGASNRTLDRRMARKYAKEISDYTLANVILVEKKGESGKYWVVDGQHRLYAISELRKQTYAVSTVIWTWEKFESLGISMSDFVSALNQGKAFTPSDDFAVHFGQSAWPPMFQAVGLSPGMSNTSKAYCWHGLVRTFLIWEDMERKQAVARPGGQQRGRRTEAWESQDPEVVERVRMLAEAMAWWRPVAEAARARKVNSLYATNVLAIAAIMYRENREMILALGTS